MSDLHLQQVSVQYAGQHAPTLHNINLTIPHDGITVVLGPSGCGKTTLLNVLAGFVGVSAGAVRDGETLIVAPAADRTVVFQDDALMPWLNVQENVELGLKIQNLPAKQRADIATKMLQQVKLSGAEAKQIWELSGGMRQRVGIARALAVRSKYLLMDEPFGALDAFTREQILAHLDKSRVGFDLAERLACAALLTERRSQFINDATRKRGHQHQTGGQYQGFFDVVGNQEKARLVVLPQIQHQILHLFARKRIQSAKRLIHQQVFGAHSQSAGNAHSLAHAA